MASRHCVRGARDMFSAQELLNAYSVMPDPECVLACMCPGGISVPDWGDISWDCRQVSSRPRRSRCCRLRCCADSPARQCRKPGFPASPSTRRRQGRTSRQLRQSRWHLAGQRQHRARRRWHLRHHRPLEPHRLRKLAALEKASSSCNDGCETSAKHGNAPWNGCSYSGGVNAAFSATCKDTLKYKSYLDCRDTKLFLGWIQREAWWHCSGMAAGKRFQTAEVRRRR